MNKVDTIIQTIAQEFYQIFDKNAVLLLFGSRANNSFNDYSDIDLAIQHKQTLNKSKLIKFKEFIDNMPMLYSVDLVDMDNASSELKCQINNNSRVL